MATLALGLAHKICCAGNPLFQHLGHSTGFCLILFVAEGVAQFMSNRKVQQAISTKTPNVSELVDAFRCPSH